MTGTVRRIRAPAAVPRAKANSAQPAGTMPERSNRAGLIRLTLPPAPTAAFQVFDQVGGEHHGHPGLGHFLHQHLHELAAGQRVKVGDWLVEQEDLGPLAQREREGGLRLLPAREPADSLVERNAQASAGTAACPGRAAA
jgi:hypothetical protein